MNRAPIMRTLIAVALVVDAAVHLHLAGGYQAGSPGGLGTGNIFRVEAVIALATAALVMWRGDRRSLAVALVVSGSACAAVVLYRYIDVAPIGPLPSMYEPVWFAEKSLSAVAEGFAALLAAGALVAARPTDGTPTRAGQPSEILGR